MASKTKTGARGLKSIVENSLHNIMYRAPILKENGVKTVRFNKYPTKDVDTYPIFVYLSLIHI